MFKKDFRALNIKICLLAFTVGMFRFFDFTIVARMPLAEIIAFGFTPILMCNNTNRRVGLPLAPVFLTFALWFIGVLISDAINGTSATFFLRGIMKPVFSFLWFLFFLNLIRIEQRALLFLPAGLFFAALQNYILPRGYSMEFVSSDGYAAISVGLVPVLVALALTTSTYVYLKNKLLAAAPFVVCAIAMMAVGAPRSAFALLLLNTGLIVYMEVAQKKFSKTSLKKELGRIFFLFTISAVGIILIFYVYALLASLGYLGELHRTKYEAQSSTIFGASPLGLIMSGRVYVFAAILGIIENPIIGYGSWSGVFMVDFYFHAVSLLETDVSIINRMLASNTGKAGHSIFFTAWLENGILAGLAMFIICYWMFKELLKVLLFGSNYSPLLIALGTSYLWAFLFSPFGIPERMTIGLFLAIKVLGLNSNKNFGIQNRRPRS